MKVSRRLRTINPIAVQSSSLANVAYDSRQAILRVEFRDGTAYQYTGVPFQTYHNLLRADSKGAYFNHRIRGIFPHEALHITGAAPFG
jgi:hypothetical protein